MGLWDAIGSAGDWLGDKIQSGGEYLQNTIDGWTDGVSGTAESIKEGTKEAIDPIVDQNKTSLLSAASDNGELDSDGLADGNSEIDESSLIKPVKSRIHS